VGIFTKPSTPELTPDPPRDPLRDELVKMQAERDTLRGQLKHWRTAYKTLVAEHSLERLKATSEHRAQVARLEAQLRAETTRADTATANFEWMRLMFNKADQEVSTLMQHTLNVQRMPFELAREPLAADDKPRPAVSSAESGVAVPVGDATQTAIGGLATSLGLDFEDVGDELAHALGVTNDNPHGRLEHLTRRSN
jgi:hypothetical protein